MVVSVSQQGSLAGTDDAGDDHQGYQQGKACQYTFDDRKVVEPAGDVQKWLHGDLKMSGRGSSEEALAQPVKLHRLFCEPQRTGIGNWW